MTEISNIITQAAQQYGMDPAPWLKTATIESGNDPHNINPHSKAAGLFQFLPSTWAKYGKGADPLDPAANADAAMRLAQDNSKHFQSTMGRQPTAGEMYLLHQQGAGGATKLLQNPDTPAIQLVGTQAVKQNGGDLGMTGRDFANRWTSQFDTPGASAAQGAPNLPSQNPPNLPTQNPAPETTSPLASMFANAATAYQAPTQPAKPPGGRTIKKPGSGVVIEA